MPDQHQFVQWFRGSSAYFNAHRGRVMVVQFGGEAVWDPAFASLIHDIALLNSLGVQLDDGLTGFPVDTLPDRGSGEARGR